MRRLETKFNLKIQKLAEESGTSYVHCLEVFDFFFQDLKQCVTSESMPSVKLTGFGSFRPTIGKIGKSLRKSYYWYNRGSKTKEALRVVVRRLWPVYRRLKKEKQGNCTYNLWAQQNKSLYDI